LLENVVFLDRDGTINRDASDYIKNRSEFVFLPRSRDAIKELTANGLTCIVITNQSAVSRKLISKNELVLVHQMMRRQIESSGGRIKDVFFCPHRPEDNCTCRKPRPGLIHQAQQKYGIDLTTAVMVGDSAKDIECARNAGCRCSVLVKTGDYREAEKQLRRKGHFPDFVAEDLLDAARWIIANLNENLIIGSG
jgi:D-glycero-D-manno-heptose 1,7-bisphosphate phosphatase